MEAWIGLVGKDLLVKLKERGIIVKPEQEWKITRLTERLHKELMQNIAREQIEQGIVQNSEEIFGRVLRTEEAREILTTYIKSRRKYAAASRRSRTR